MLIQLSANGDVQINRRILRTGWRTTNAGPAFNLIGEFLISEEIAQFDSEGEHASGGWAPRAETPHDDGHPILNKSGELRDSYTDRHSSLMLFEADDQHLLYGSLDPKAKFHQLGTSEMPRRRPLELTEQARGVPVKVLQRWIVSEELMIL